MATCLTSTERLLCRVGVLDEAPNALAVRASEAAGTEPPGEDEKCGYEVGDVVELHGRSGCGKTLTLRCVLRALCVAPRAEVSTIVVVDADGRWPDAEDAAAVSEWRALRSSSGTGGSAVDWPDMYVVRCPGGTLDVAAALWHARDVHLAGREPHGRCVILLDSINSFYWEDRCDGEAGSARMQALDAALANLAMDEEARCIAFITRHDYFVNSSANANTAGSGPTGTFNRSFVKYCFHLDDARGVCTVGDIQASFSVNSDLLPLLEYHDP